MSRAFTPTIYTRISCEFLYGIKCWVQDKKIYIVGGRIDKGVGTIKNGNKPTVQIDGQGSRFAISLGCLAEVKAADIPCGYVTTETMVDNGGHTSWVYEFGAAALVFGLHTK